MSHLALRRVMIRLLHDPAFAAAVYADPEGTLADVELSATERAWLTAESPAAWRTDAERPARVLAALAEEFPATLVLAAEHAERFFTSPEFHGAVQERGSLAGAFGAYLARAPDSRAHTTARLERAIAEVRRAERRPSRLAGDRLALATNAAVVRVPPGALALLADLRAGRAAGALGPGEELVLVTAPPGGCDVTLEALEPGLGAVLGRAAGGCTRADLLAEARRQGAEPGEDAEIVARLVDDGLLVGAVVLAV